MIRESGQSAELRVSAAALRKGNAENLGGLRGVIQVGLIEIANPE